MWTVRITGMLVVAVLMLAGRGLCRPGASSPKCSAVTFTVSLDAGKSFTQRVGDLLFKIHATHGKALCRGWIFSLDDGKGNDFIYPVNMPLRFNPSEYLACSYGLTARQGLEMKRGLRFILTEQEYQRLHPLMVAALWPGDSPDPEHAAERYLKALATVRTGLLRLSTLHFKLSPDGLIRSATFRVELIAPSSFHFNPAQNPHPAGCPAASN